MFKILFLLCLLLNPLWATVKISAHFSEAANYYEILDHLSQWFPGFTDDEYLKYFDQNKLLRPQDREFFSKYRLIRKKYYSDPDQKEKDPLKNRNGFFATIGSKQDQFADHFYAASSLKEALQSFSKTGTKDEVIFLEKFYENFKDRINPLLIEGKKLETKVVSINQYFMQGNVQRFLSQMQNFYQLTGDAIFKINYIWWPPIQRHYANSAGDFLIVRESPTVHANKLNQDIIVHELNHSLSAKMALNKKTEFTKQFLSKCSVQNKMRKLEILEEPLAVAIAQIEFVSQVDPINFVYAEKLYNNPWNSHYGKVLAPLVKKAFTSGEQLNADFISQASFLCDELLQVASKISK